MNMFNKLKAPSKCQLWAEFFVLFVGAPLIMAFFMPPSWIYRTIMVMLVIGIVLLVLTPSWRWRRLIEGKLLPEWRAIFIFTVLAIIGIGGTVLAVVPERFLDLPTHRPEIMLVIATMYPIVLVIPQEVLFRPLFFSRYGNLFKSNLLKHGVNAVVFSLAHLFYWNLPALILTGLGSIAFSWAYETRRSFPLAWLMHAIGGVLVFALGLSVFFYHGAINS